MGFLDSILGGEEQSQKLGVSRSQSVPLDVSLSFSPLRLSANRTSSVDLLVRVKNISSDSQLISVDALLQRNACIGFESACLNKSIEKKVGDLKPGISIEIPIRIWSNNQTKPGTYSVSVSVYCHYLDYVKVLNTIKRNTTLRSV